MFATRFLLRRATAEAAQNVIAATKAATKEAAAKPAAAVAAAGTPAAAPATAAFAKPSTGIVSASTGAAGLEGSSGPDASSLAAAKSSEQVLPYSHYTSQKLLEHLQVGLGAQTFPNIRKLILFEGTGAENNVLRLAWKETVSRIHFHNPIVVIKVKSSDIGSLPAINIIYQDDSSYLLKIKPNMDEKTVSETLVDLAKKQTAPAEK